MIRICARARGPLVVEGFAPGEVEIVDESGRVIGRADATRYLLCRCGASKTRPLCDGSHHRTPAPVDIVDDDATGAEQPTEP